jgi:hypothetical protein
MTWTVWAQGFGFGKWHSWQTCLRLLWLSRQQTAVDQLLVENTALSSLAKINLNWHEPKTLLQQSLKSHTRLQVYGSVAPLLVNLGPSRTSGSNLRQAIPSYVNMVRPKILEERNRVTGAAQLSLQAKSETTPQLLKLQLFRFTRDSYVIRSVKRG